jgi:serine/threonine protein kinase/tetratricopeptide (TPR) repeat protein
MDLIGRTFGAYRVRSLLGSGGMGEVYLAHDSKLDRLVALKLLAPALAGDPDRLRRFLQEARSASSLNHPHILVIHDVGELDRRPFIVSEFVEGETLRERLRRGPVPIRDGVAIAIQIAGALQAAHARGLVHRDIKPENVMVRPDGYVKVLDFGLAKSTAPAATGGDSLLETQPGTILGTPRYMSPQQARGLDVDAQTDVWSLGVILYEMVSGRPPFDGATASDIMAAVLRGDPAPLDPQAPAALSRLIDQALAKEPGRRFASAGDLLVELLSVQSALDSSLHRDRTPPSAPPRARRSQAIDSLAVLPLVNGSGDPDTEYFCDGVTESTIASLSSVPKLRVMARSTTFRYKGRDVDPVDVGRELNVRAVLTGRLTQRGERLAIALELVDVLDGSRLWGARYDSQVSDIFDLEEKIATEVSDKLRLRLTGPERTKLVRRRTDNVTAYQAYLRGRYAWNRRVEAGFRQAIRYFEEAIAADPAYALPYAGLADCYALLGIAEYGGMRPGEAMSRARAAAQTALDIDDQLAEAHTTLAHVTGFYDWNWSSADRHFTRAIELKPTYAFSHHWYALFLVAMGRAADGIASELRALELEPLSLIINKNVGTLYYYARDYERAIDQYKRALELDADFSRSHVYLGMAYDAVGRHDDAARELAVALGQSGGSGVIVGLLGHALGAAGRHAEARNLLAELTAREATQYVPAFNRALIHVGLGEVDLAFEQLNRAFEERSSWLVSLNVEPLLDSIRDDPRFADLVSRVGLP